MYFFDGSDIPRPILPDELMTNASFLFVLSFKKLASPVPTIRSQPNLKISLSSIPIPLDADPTSTNAFFKALCPIVSPSLAI